MEEKEKCETCPNQNCGSCPMMGRGTCGFGHGMCGFGHGMCGFGRRGWMIKKLIIVAVIAIAFCTGMQVGEMKGIIRSNHGYGFKSMDYRNASEMKDIWNKMSAQIDDQDSNSLINTPEIKN